MKYEKYRKKPVAIDAVQWLKNGDHPEDATEMLQLSNGDDDTQQRLVTVENAILKAQRVLVES